MAAALQLRTRHRVLHNPSIVQFFSSSTTLDSPDSDLPPIKPRRSSFSKKSLSTIFKSLKSNTAFHKPVWEDRYSFSNLRPSWFVKELEEIESRIGYNNNLRSSLLSIMQADEEKARKKTSRSIDKLRQSTPGPDSMEPPQEHLVEKYSHPYTISSVEKLKIELAKFKDDFKMSESDCGSALQGSLKSFFMHRTQQANTGKVDAAQPKAPKPPKPPKASNGKSTRKKVKTPSKSDSTSPTTDEPSTSPSTRKRGDPVVAMHMGEGALDVNILADDPEVAKLVSLKGLSSIDIYLGKVESSQVSRLILRLKDEESICKVKDELARAKKDISTLEAALKDKANQLSSFEKSLSLATKELAGLKAALKDEKKQINWGDLKRYYEYY